MANFEFKYGSMSSGKSMALLQVAYNYNQYDMKVCLIKPKIDTKGEDYLVSRIGPKRKVDIVLDKEESLLKNKFSSIYSDAKCILVDEAQFLTKEQVEDLWYISKIKNINVLCYGLKVDFKGELFEGSKRLFELADKYEELSTICSCGKKARQNARMVNNKFVYDGDKILIDNTCDEVKYVPLCSKCYLEKVFLKREAIKEKLKTILTSDDVVKEINKNLEFMLIIIPEINDMIGFEHKNHHHALDVWNHTLLSLATSKNDFDIRLSLLLHDIGKPFSFKDKNIRTFFNHANVSKDMSKTILERLGYDKLYINDICFLVGNHDKKITSANIRENYDLCMKLYEVQYADALAHDPKEVAKRLKYFDKINKKITKVRKKN